MVKTTGVDGQVSGAAGQVEQAAKTKEGQAVAVTKPGKPRVKSGEPVRPTNLLARLVSEFREVEGDEGRSLRDATQFVKDLFGIDTKSEKLPAGSGEKLFNALSEKDSKKGVTYEQVKLVIEDDVFREQIILPKGVLMSLMNNADLNLEAEQIFNLISPFEEQIAERGDPQEIIVFEALKVHVSSEGETLDFVALKAFANNFTQINYTDQSEAMLVFAELLEVMIPEGKEEQAEILNIFTNLTEEAKKAFTKEVDVDKFKGILGSEDVKDFMDFMIGSKSLVALEAGTAGKLEDATIDIIVNSPQFAEFMNRFAAETVDKSMGMILSGNMDKDSIHMAFTQLTRSIMTKAKENEYEYEKLTDAEKAFMDLVNKFDDIQKASEPEKKSKVEKIGGFFKAVAQRIGLGFVGAGVLLKNGIAPLVGSGGLIGAILAGLIVAGVITAPVGGFIVLGILGAAFVTGFLIGAIGADKGLLAIQTFNKSAAEINTLTPVSDTIIDKLLTDAQKQAYRDALAKLNKQADELAGRLGGMADQGKEGAEKFESAAAEAQAALEGN